MAGNGTKQSGKTTNQSVANGSQQALFWHFTICNMYLVWCTCSATHFTSVVGGINTWSRRRAWLSTGWPSMTVSNQILGKISAALKILFSSALHRCDCWNCHVVKIFLPSHEIKVPCAFLWGWKQITLQHLPHAKEHLTSILWIVQQQFEEDWDTAELLQ